MEGQKENCEEMGDGHCTFIGTKSLLSIWFPDSGFLQSRMINDQDLGFFANFLGIFVFVLVIAYHYVMADPKYEGN
ncbi:hypothetical protein DM860_002308 [Cuscuta australis]|uniref:Dolichyl-diphosphooligosaccharide--protein glycosyltransferase subunit 4 n=1 Tax=Cuscuta australis TaxID=267555 RepID=A0A328D048_9ASTE|nr:hypothetical protein DM860_002308 [Cuscuta australis]